ncbi:MULTISPECIES: ABC transporter substrate-binding protein [unclassified Agarivorans]|uniref:ABC transporter substrate-binding protein n=1 Tax=unclassified Agarivorans TaxID=2636026 RepID=UPI003D7C84ED
MKLIRTVLFTLCCCFLNNSNVFALTTTFYIDDLGRSVAVPVHPKRLVSTYDVDITIPLIELGILPIGSHGRLNRNGTPYLRSSARLTGVDFDNSSISFIGATKLDLEKIVSLKPDLIITEKNRSTPIELLARIAPTVVIDSSKGAPQVYRKLAKLTASQVQLGRLERRYAMQIAALKNSIGSATITASVFQSLRGKLSVYHSYRALGQVLRDAGFHFPELINAIDPGQRISLSVERLPELDADIIFSPYRADQAGGAATEIAHMNTMLANFCNFLQACRSGNYVLVPRDLAISNSYAGLQAMATMVQAHLIARPKQNSLPDEPIKPADSAFIP